MQKPRYRLKGLLLFILACSSQLLLAMDETPIVDFCGEATHIGGFSLDASGRYYWLPKYVRIERDGRVLFQDESPKDWYTPYKGVSFTTFGKLLLIKTYDQDCVDIFFERLFIVFPDGSVLHQPVWTSNWRGGFFVEDGKLEYWSEWFCSPSNEERTPGRTLVYVFSEERRKFERSEVPESRFCGRKDIPEFIKFEKAKAEPLH